MNVALAGAVVLETEVLVDGQRVHLLADAIGSDTADVTALRVPFFGPTVAGQKSVIGSLQMDLRRALLGGQSYEWHRPFRIGETVRVKIMIEDILDKGHVQLATVLAEFRDADAALIQRQRTIFIERSPPA